MRNKSLYEIIFRSNYLQLYYLALRYVGDEDVARDIVGDAFFMTLKKIDGISTDKLKGYLYTCVRNMCLKHIASSKRSVSIDTAGTAIISDDDIDRWIERERRLEEIEEEIEKMPERTRFVLQQCYYEKHTYREVADMLGITTDGVKKHISKALSLLRVHFNKDKHK